MTEGGVVIHMLLNVIYYKKGAVGLCMKLHICLLEIINLLIRLSIINNLRAQLHKTHYVKVKCYYN